MNDTVEVKKETMTLERIALAAVVGLLSWNVYTTNQLSISQAVTQAKLEALTTGLAASQLDRYTRSEATADATVVANRVARLEQWNERLADRINTALGTIGELEGQIDLLERRVVGDEG